MGAWIILFSFLLSVVIFILGGRICVTNFIGSSKLESAGWIATIGLSILIFLGGFIIGANYKDSYKITSVTEFYTDEGDSYFEVYCQYGNSHCKLMLTKEEFHSLLSEDGEALELSGEDLNNDSYFSINL